MSDPFDLPERELPDSVRQAARLRVLERMEEDKPRRRRPGPAPWLIASSVVLLMAGATVFTSTLTSNKDHKTVNASPTTAPSTTSSGESGAVLWNAVVNWGTGEEMQRCATVVPQQSTWVPLLRVNRNGMTALLYRIGTDIVFCQLTREQVTAKALPFPDPPAGKAPAKILFTTPEGTTAGVVAPDVRTLAIMQTEHQLLDAAAVDNGVFILPNSYRPTEHVALIEGGFGDYTVPSADIPQATPPGRIADDPKADRASPAGQRLAACLAAADPPVTDADYWTAGAFRQTDDTHWLQLASLGNSIVACNSDGTDHYTVDQPTLDSAGHAVQITGKVSADGNSGLGVLLVGLATDPNAATVTLSRPGQADVTGAVDHGTVILAGDGQVFHAREVDQITVKDAAGTVIDQFKQ